LAVSWILVFLPLLLGSVAAVALLFFGHHDVESWGSILWAGVCFIGGCCITLGLAIAKLFQ